MIDEKKVTLAVKLMYLSPVRGTDGFEKKDFMKLSGIPDDFVETAPYRNAFDEKYTSLCLSEAPPPRQHNAERTCTWKLSNVSHATIFHGGSYLTFVAAFSCALVLVMGLALLATLAAIRLWLFGAFGARAIIWGPLLSLSDQICRTVWWI